jgi:hypothetical protein
VAVKDKYGNNLRRGHRVTHAEDSRQGELVGTAGGINNALVLWDDEEQTENIKGYRLVSSEKRMR